MDKGSYLDCDADYSSPSSAKFKSAMPCDFMTWWAIKHGDNFLYGILIFGVVFLTNNNSLLFYVINRLSACISN